MISVCACDLQPIAIEGLKAVLTQAEEMQFVASCDSLEQASRQIELHRPTVQMVDRSFGMHVLLEWVGRTSREYPQTQLVVWSAAISDVECFRVLKAGARGILRKGSPIPALFHCLKSVARKEIWTESLFSFGDSPLRHARTRPLTPREQQVADLVSKGMKNREIAEALNIATGTVKIHLMHIFEKTGIRDRFELALHGLRLACENEDAVESAKEYDEEASPLLTSER